MIFFDHFFCKICVLWLLRRKAFILGSCRSFFWALGTVSQKGGGFSKNEGGFYALKCFSNVMLQDMLAVKYKDKLKTFTELFFYKRTLALMKFYLYLYYYDSAI